MPVADSQGILLQFGGVTLGRITSVSTAQSVSGEFDCTSLLSTVIGDGANTRVIQQLNPTTVAPGTLTISFLGAPGFGLVDQGRVAPLVFQLPTGWSLTGLAYLSEFNTEAVAGEKLKGTATFTITGFFN